MKMQKIEMTIIWAFCQTSDPRPQAGQKDFKHTLQAVEHHIIQKAWISWKMTSRSLIMQQKDYLHLESKELHVIYNLIEHCCPISLYKRT